jgi:hypothetical protein
LLSRWNAHAGTPVYLLQGITLANQFALVSTGGNNCLCLWKLSGASIGQTNLCTGESSAWDLRINTFGYREHLYKKAEKVVRGLKSMSNVSFHPQVEE